VSEPTLDVVGIGNALVDVLSHETDEFIETMSLNRGAMTLIDADRAGELYSAMGPGIEVSGGSAANTMAGIASLGGTAGYLGRVAGDQLGEVFGHDLRSTGVEFATSRSVDGPPTGRCLIVVTPDAERTMSTFLGASSILGPDDIDTDLVGSAALTFLEGYLFDLPPAKQAYWVASREAHAQGRQVSLTLSDTFCVERHRPEWLDLVHDQVDVLFANADELQALYECDLEQAIDRVRNEVEISFVTRGPSGSVVVTADALHEVPAVPVEKVEDTTGAGDLYASGALFGLARGFELSDCAHLGSIAASEVISHTGARPAVPLVDLIPSRLR
jgi:sugar/nucleoside kinase (ribokinase family)